MDVVGSIERGLDWLSTPKILPGRFEMETQRGRRLELEVVSFKVRLPLASGVTLKFPVFFTVLPVGTSPVHSPGSPPAQEGDEAVDRPS